MAIFRLIVFFIILLVFIVLERKISRRPVEMDQRRLGTNIALGFAGIFIIKFIAPLTLVHAAYLTQDRNFGLIQLLNLAPLSLPLGFVLFDLLLYWQHRFFHQVNFFWQFHRLHHEDEFLDVSSAVRFHPIEYLLSYSLKLTFILLIGIGPWTIVVCEIWLSSMSIFSHSNIEIPQKLENILKKYIITPDYHFVHHSLNSIQMNSNYCNGFSIWDKIFQSQSASDKTIINEVSLGVNQDT